jgi:UDP-3-O-[3-hydroxymyristoyl] N-acetylglucosamine deacetylase/3-hydroxyacyl-[acyl-carrier-protein] dehydratase
LSKEPLRFKEEFVRHKILDIIGDIALLGMPLKAHIIAVRTGHALNSKLTLALKEKLVAGKDGKKGAKAVAKVVPADAKSLDIRQVLDLLPHRYPFIMIDRVSELIDENELVAIKNVTINEPYFQGHFPGVPVMPGVLQVEAMAQAAGILMLRRVSSEGKIAFFMSADKVKFRQAVVPGDQIEVRVKLTKSRGLKIGVAEGTCSVNGKVVSSAELMFTILDTPEEAGA